MSRTRQNINLENATLEEVLSCQKCTPNRKSYWRLKIVEKFYRGYGTKELATIEGCSLRTMQRLVNLWNQKGIDGILDKGSAGRPRKIDRERFKDQLIPLFLHPDQCQESHWTAIKFHGYVQRENLGELHYTTLLRYLWEHNFTLLRPRPVAHKQDQEAREIFITRIKELIKDDACELWFADESGIDGDPRPRQMWAKVGSHPTVKYSGTHLRANVIAAVQPKIGEIFSLTIPYADTEVFQCFLDQFAKEKPVDPLKKIYLILDNASWHKSKALNWHHILPLYLPAYSPDLNPIEILWLAIKNTFFHNWYTKSADELNQRLCDALNHFISNPAKVASNANLSKFN